MTHRATLAFAALAFATPAHASLYWNDNGLVIERPPGQYAHAPTGPVVEIQRDFADIAALCGGRDPAGCAEDTGNPARDGAALLSMMVNGTTEERALIQAALNDPRHPWVIVVPRSNGFRYSDLFVTHVRCHEWAHVNGWEHGIA